MDSFDAWLLRRLPPEMPSRVTMYVFPNQSDSAGPWHLSTITCSNPISVSMPASSAVVGL
eukprot:8208-Eustigmatos_ZCMA.PRE.1